MLHPHVGVHTQALLTQRCVSKCTVADPMWMWGRCRSGWIHTCLQLYILWVGWLPTAQHFLTCRKVAIDLICLCMCVCVCFRVRLYVCVCVGSLTESTSEGCCLMFSRDSAALPCVMAVCLKTPCQSWRPVWLIRRLFLQRQKKPTKQNNSVAGLKLLKCLFVPTHHHVVDVDSNKSV